MKGSISAETMRKELAREIRHAIMEVLDEEGVYNGSRSVIDSKIDKILLRLLPGTLEIPPHGKKRAYKEVLAEWRATQQKQNAEFDAIRAKYKYGTPAFNREWEAANVRWGKVSMEYNLLLDSCEDSPDWQDGNTLSGFAETLLECSAEDDGGNGDLPAAAVAGLMKMRDSKKPTLKKAEAKAIWAHIGEWPDDGGLFKDVASAKRFCKRFL